MKQYLKYIKEVIEVRLKGTTSTFENLVSLFIMNEEASDDEISTCDLLLNKKLPDEYKFFLQNYNGGIL
ncbi:SMI1/KNR4 family protein, partial [Flavobacterium piscis]